MRVTPITSEQADEQSVGDPWPPGEYDFTVSEAVEGTSQASGNEQIKLTLHVFNRQGQQRTVFDYLSSAPKSQWKVRHFAETVGMVRQYETGEMPVREMLGRPGRCKLRIKPADGQYSAQNAVNDYVKNDGAAQKHEVRPSPALRQKAPAGDLDDDIPF